MWCLSAWTVYSFLSYWTRYKCSLLRQEFCLLLHKCYAKGGYNLDAWMEFHPALVCWNEQKEVAPHNCTATGLIWGCVLPGIVDFCLQTCIYLTVRLFMTSWGYDFLPFLCFKLYRQSLLLFMWIYHCKAEILSFDSCWCNIGAQNVRMIDFSCVWTGKGHFPLQLNTLTWSLMHSFFYIILFV
jgi:hypothetical protein